MNVDLVLENCRIATTRGILDADIAVDNGVIVQVARSANMPEADKWIDIDGKMVLPGRIDPHVHFREPGYTHKGDFESESVAALCGGTTTIFDMPNTKPRTCTAEALEEKRGLAKKCCVDYGILYEVTDENAEDLEYALGYKAYFDSGRISYGGLQRAFEMVEGKRFFIHAEDLELIDEGEYNKEAGSHSVVRGEKAEVRCVERILGLDLRGNHVHFCHVTTEKALGMIKNFGQGVSCEVTPHHAFFDYEDYNRLGVTAKVNPPIRKEKMIDHLTEFDMVGTDHAPHLMREKTREIKDVAAGFPSVEVCLPLLATRVNEGVLSWEELVRLTSTGPAEVFGLEDRGEIGEGKVADIVVVDNGLEKLIEADGLHSKCGWTPYEGWNVKGCVDKVFFKGRLVVDAGELVEKPRGEEILL